MTAIRITSSPGSPKPILIILLIVTHASAQEDPPPPAKAKDEIRGYLPPDGVKCISYSPRISSGNVVYHENETFQIRLTTDISIELEQNHVSCIQVDVEGNRNSTESIESIFYTFSYVDYTQEYSVRESFNYGIPEFRSECKCDCPKSDEFCSYRFGHKYCSRDSVCVQKFYDKQHSHGCQHSTDGAKVCCTISVRPYRNRKFTAVRLATPTSSSKIEIDIYVLYQGKWSLFRQYTEKVAFNRNTYLHLNGNDNVANMDIRARGAPATFNLNNLNTKYFSFEVGLHEFRLMERPVSNFHTTNGQRLRFLEFKRNRWTVHNPLVKMTRIHEVSVVNCQAQVYTDRYNLEDTPYVIRNSTGALNFIPKDGPDLKRSHAIHVRDIQLLERGSAQTIVVRHNSPPPLNLVVKLEQKLNVVSHLHASYLENFVAKICLDKYRNRFLNVTLVNAFGKFGIKIFKDSGGKHLDLSLSLTASLPLSINHTEIMALPGHISENRYVCVYPDARRSRARCKWTSFQEEPLEWYELPHAFVQTEGNCPGCNEHTKEGFLSFLNPRNWFKGINSWSEGVAVAVEIVVYILILIVILAVFRRCIWPVIRWALCSTGSPGPVRYPRKDKFVDQEVI